MTRTHSIFTFIIASLLFISCSDKVDYEEFTTELKTQISTPDSTKEKSKNDIESQLYQVYSTADFQPIWINEEGKAEDAEKLLTEIKELKYEGLQPGSYGVEELSKRLSAIQNNKGSIEPKAAVQFDMLYTKAYIKAANDLMFGVSEPNEISDLWYHDNDTVINIIEPFKDNKAPSLAYFRSKIPTYQALIDFNKADSTGKADSLKGKIYANLERLRWLPQELAKSNVLVIIPKMELYLRENDKDVMNMRVIVGKTSRETPTLNADMKNVVFNPSWGVPPGIMRKDVVPGLLSKGKGYLAKKGLKAYDRNGNEVDPSVITEANYKNYIFRQPPSEKNALGQVKFDLPNPYAIYLHDTPHRELFNNDNRANSSGCIRVHKPRELADYILTEMDKKDYTMAEINEIVSHNKTEYVKLKHKVPVHIVYLTAYKPYGGNLEFYDDIYNLDGDFSKIL